MGIRFHCPNGHKLNVKSFQAGRRGICPYCGQSVQIPTESTRRSGGGQSVQIPAPIDQTPPGPKAQTSAEVVKQPANKSTESESPAAVAPVQMPDVTVPDSSAEPSSGPATSQVPPAANGVVDPLAEAPDVVWYVRPSSGGQFGPAAGDVMRTWITEGRVTGDSLVWREGWRDWQEASAVFAELGASRRSPAPTDIVTEGASASSGLRSGYSPRWRRRSKTSNVIVVTVLLLAVVVLSIVLFVLLAGVPDWLGQKGLGVQGSALCSRTPSAARGDCPDSRAAKMGLSPSGTDKPQPQPI